MLLVEGFVSTGFVSVLDLGTVVYSLPLLTQVEFTYAPMREAAAPDAFAPDIVRSYYRA